jgi:hypothetical protein
MNNTYQKYTIAVDDDAPIARTIVIANSFIAENRDFSPIRLESGRFYK